MTTSSGRRTAVILMLGLVCSFAAAQGEHISPPPLVPCDAASEGKPCVEIVTEVGAIVGVWRRYLGATAMGYSEFRDDGTVGVLSILPSDGRASGSIHFEDGVAAIAANAEGPLPRECVIAGSYELRLIRFGEHPVVLSFTRLAEDRCPARVESYLRPMVFYSGSGEGLRMSPSLSAFAQSLVPCADQADEPSPCDEVVTRAEDAAGIWKQYVSRPDLQAPDGMGYQRIGVDGRYTIADAPENTRTPFGNYPYGTYVFEDAQVWLSDDAPDAPQGCETARQRFHVYRYGAQPVALLAVPLLDRCATRLQDLRLPLVWVADAD